MLNVVQNHHTYTHFHFFCGLGAAAKGVNRGHARVGITTAKFECLGGVDNNPAAIADFERMAGVKGTLLDMFSRQQYLAFHGRPPPFGWQEATADDIRRAAQYRRPDFVFLSAPCKGFSGLLPEEQSKTPKYQALNQLTLRGVYLMCEAFADDPVSIIAFENVPRIATRGRHLLDQIIGMLRNYGYAVAETTHDCGELGGLAQTRKRFLLMCRHTEKVPPFLYVPQKKPLATVGSLLDRMPLPGAPEAGVMHRIPRLQWMTWLRLAFVRAGADWRSLQDLRVSDNELMDYALMPSTPAHAGHLGVQEYDRHSCAVRGRSSATNGAFSLADPRSRTHEDAQFYEIVPRTDTMQPLPNPSTSLYASGYGVNQWNKPTSTVAGESLPSNGRFAVADPRINGHPKSVQLGVRPYYSTGPTVTGQMMAGQGPFSIADVRYNWKEGAHQNKMRVTASTGPTNTITGSDRVGSGALSIADTRIEEHRPFDTYDIVSETPVQPKANTPCLAIIKSLDNTWHRPFTTLELAVIQGFIEPEEHLELEGLSDQAKRERIGNAVPPPSAEAIGSAVLHTLLLAEKGETFMLSSSPIWVQPALIGLALPDMTETCH